MSKIANKQMICEVLMEAAKTDKDIVALCSDSRGSGSFTPFAETYPDQFVETGIAGGEMTGKFRKVASHSAPEPAFGLFLNLPEGTSPLCSGPHRANVHWTLCAPLEPRHVNGVSIPAKCPPDIPTEHLLID